MEDRKIHDRQIKAKSWLYFERRDSRYYRPEFARLNYKRLSGGWCSADFDEYPGQYIEVDLLENTRVTGIATQGRHRGQEWVERFKLEYRRVNETKYRQYQENGSSKVSSFVASFTQEFRQMLSFPSDKKMMKYKNVATLFF